ncbi:SUKH-4 family immunity protein [Streptomyces sp. MS1.AVA.3]|uniref:SUKH-4 family immunity protein n=1 Tax=Streptomyces decoyicus TaxID=249567 RepID=UPI0030C3CBB3
MPEPFVGPLAAPGEWACPAPALTQDGPSQSWLEATFGHHTCRVLEESRLPAGLSEEDARHFLTTTGLPALPDQLPFMSTVDLHVSGLVEAPWPEDTEQPESDGPFYTLGEWTGGPVLLDGTTGAVVQDGRTGYAAVPDTDHWEQVFDGDLDTWGIE